MPLSMSVLGVDLGKNWFHLVCMDRDGKVMLRKRLNRAQLGAFAASMATCRVAMESCPGSQFWGRCFTTAGHDVRNYPGSVREALLEIQQKRLQRRGSNRGGR
jgi:transposase